VVQRRDGGDEVEPLAEVVGEVVGLDVLGAAAGALRQRDLVRVTVDADDARDAGRREVTRQDALTATDVQGARRTRRDPVEDEAVVVRVVVPPLALPPHLGTGRPAAAVLS